MKHNFSRRDLLKLGAAGAAVTSLAGCATIDAQPLGRVVVVGGGYGGATAAKYIRIWSEGRIDVTLVEPAESFVSCPMSNLVIGGSRKLAEIMGGAYPELNEKRALIDETPGLYSAGRFYGTDDPDRVGWDGIDAIHQDLSKFA